MLILPAYTMNGWNSGGGVEYFVGLCSLIVRVDIGPNVPMSELNSEILNVSTWLQAIIFRPKQKRLYFK